MNYSTGEILIVILLMSLVTYFPRSLPLIFLSRRGLPPLLKTWLSYIPVAVLAALLGPLLLLEEGEIALRLSQNPYLWVAFPSFVAALWTKNMFITVLTGIFIMATVRFYLL